MNARKKSKKFKDKLYFGTEFVPVPPSILKDSMTLLIFRPRCDKASYNESVNKIMEARYSSLLDRRKRRTTPNNKLKRHHQPLNRR